MPKLNPKVTVTMPAYNASKYINEAIKSVLTQDYNSFELLILDDGSTDNTWDIIRQYRKDPRVRIYRNKKNSGGGAARNKTIRLARGKYISFCDADDLMLPGNLKTLSKFLDNHQEIGMVYPRALVIKTDINNKMLGSPYLRGQNPDKDWDLLKNTIGQGGAMVRKCIIIKAGGYDETSYYSPVDYGLWLRLAEIASIKYIDSNVYHIINIRTKRLESEDKRLYNAYKLHKISQAIERRYGFKL